MAQTTAPSETPDDSNLTSGTSEGSTMAPMEQGILSSGSLGRIKMALPPSLTAAGDSVHESRPAGSSGPLSALDKGQAPGDGSGGVAAASRGGHQQTPAAGPFSEQAALPAPPTATSGRLNPSGIPALPAANIAPSSTTRDAPWTAGASSRFLEPVIGTAKEQEAATSQGGDASSMPEATFPPGQRPQQAPSPSSGKVTLPRAVSLKKVPASGRLDDDPDEPEEIVASSPSPSQTLTGSGRIEVSVPPSLPSPPDQATTTMGASSPALPSPAPGFTLLPDDLKEDIPADTAGTKREKASTSAAEETIELPKATGPLEAPPFVVAEVGAATTFLPDAAEEAPLANAITKLQGACRELVDRVYKIRGMKSGLQVISALVDLVNDLDARYVTDTGITQRDGMEDLLVEMRRSVAEGDRFILESLENGRGGLSAAAFERDLKTIARGDQPRILMAYATFLVSMISRELQRYLQPLEVDEWRRREVLARLNYLLDGVRDVLLARLTNAKSNK